MWRKRGRGVDTKGLLKRRVFNRAFTVPVTDFYLFLGGRERGTLLFNIVKSYYPRKCGGRGELLQRGHLKELLQKLTQSLEQMTKFLALW